MIIESESTRPSVPINVASSPELIKQVLSLEGVTCAMIEVVTPIKKSKLCQTCRLLNGIEYTNSYNNMSYLPSKTMVPLKIALKKVM